MHFQPQKEQCGLLPYFQRSSMLCMSESVKMGIISKQQDRSTSLYTRIYNIWHRTLLLVYVCHGAEVLCVCVCVCVCLFVCLCVSVCLCVCAYFLLYLSLPFCEWLSPSPPYTQRKVYISIYKLMKACVCDVQNFQGHMLNSQHLLLWLLQRK